MPPTTPALQSSSPPRSVVSERQFRVLLICTAILVLCFAKPLYNLFQLALHNELYSHILLIPFVSLYLAWLKKPEFMGQTTEVNPPPEVRGPWSVVRGPLFLAAALLTLGSYFSLRSRLSLAPIDSLSWTTFSFFLLFVSVCCFALRPATLRALAFPIGFLVFIVPFPMVVRDGIEAFLQHASASAADWLFSLVGTPLVRTGVAFQLPGFSLQVAPECSGIRSTLVLFITSLVAGQLFLRTPWKRALFALVVIPLGIVRNAIRIVTIGELCVHVDPAFIDSPLHHRGGPVFFAVSMVPFLLLLWWLRKTESGKQKTEN